jgi:hypothetical protein
VVTSFGVEVALNFVLFVVVLVCTGVTARRIGNLKKIPAVQ